MYQCRWKYNIFIINLTTVNINITYLEIFMILRILLTVLNNKVMKRKREMQRVYV